MNIYIPSRGRWAKKFLDHNCSPLRWLTPELRKRTFYCVRDDEADAYWKLLRKEGVQILEMGEANSLGEKRDKIAATCKRDGEKKFMMCDDDVRLFVRTSPEEWNLRYAKPREVNTLFDKIEDFLDSYPMVGISAREGNNREGIGGFPMIRECTRSMRMYAFRTKDYLSIKANRLHEMADFDTVLQFLRSGRKNAVIFYWAQGQTATQHPGGCSIYRTNESHAKVCHQLAKLHPGFVKVVQKENKGSVARKSGFGVRTEVKVQWQKAYKSSQGRDK